MPHQPDGAETPAAGVPEKQIASLRARAALVGHVVHQLADDGYIVVSTKWAGMARHCPDLAALGAFIGVLEGKL